MNPEKALEIVKGIGQPVDDAPEVAMLQKIVDQLYAEIEMKRCEARGIERAIEILRQC